MQTIEQEQPNKSKRYDDNKVSRNRNFFDDEMDNMGFSSSSSSKYKFYNDYWKKLCELLCCMNPTNVDKPNL